MKRIIIFMLTLLMGLSLVNALSINNTLPSELGAFEIDFRDYVSCNDAIYCNITVENTTTEIVPSYNIADYSFIESQSVIANTPNPTDIFFKPDGLKMYIIGSDDAVNEYDLITAWNITTAIYNQQFSVSSQDSNPTGLFFKPDGLVMYIAGQSSTDLYQYDLSTPWDVSTAVFDDNTGASGLPSGLDFKPDGTKLYYINSQGDTVVEYSLSTPWDVTTKGSATTFSINAQEATPKSMVFNNDGSKFFVIGFSNDEVFEYDLSTEYSISSASYSGQSLSVTGAAPYGLTFQPEGQTFYYTEQGTDSVYSYGLPSAEYIFTSSGAKPYTIFAGDWTNINETGSILVNPIATFQFTLSNGTQVKDFTFGGRSDLNGTVSYDYIGDTLNFGNNTLQFNKDGFQVMDFTFQLQDSPPTLNKVYNVTPAQLTINIFDRETGSPLSQLVNLQLTGASGLEVNTSNGSITLPGTLLVAGQYNLLATSNEYFSDQRIFTFTNQDDLTLNIYMLNETSPNAGQIIIIVENEKQELTSNVVVTMLEQDAATNSFFEVTDVTTNINGQSFFGIELGTKKYIWRALDPVTGVSGQSSIGGERVFIDADSRTIVLRFATLQKSNLLDGFFYDVQENATARQNNISNIIVTWDDTSNILNDVCVKYYKDTGLSKILLNSFCEASSSGFLETNVFVNTSFNTIAEVTVNPQGLLLDSFVYVSADSFETIFSSMGITDYFVLFLFIAAIGLGIWANIPWFSGIATMCVAWFWVSIFPSYSSSGIATVITLICIGIIYAEVKKE